VRGRGGVGKDTLVGSWSGTAQDAPIFRRHGMSAVNRSQPPLSIGLPLRNGERYLPAAVESILGQTYVDFELIIADNASNDRSEEICREFATQDRRVRYIRHTADIGLAANHNFVVTQARGELFRWAAHDDVLAATCLERCVDLFAASGAGVAIAFPRTRVIGPDGAHLWDWNGQGSVDQDRPSERLRALLEHPNGHLQILSSMYGVSRRGLLRQTRLLQPFYRSDLVLIVELALRGNLIEVPEFLYLRRNHSEQHGLGRTQVVQGGLARRAPHLLPNRNFRRYPMIHTWVMRGWVQAVLRAPIPGPERLRCLKLLGAALGRDRRARIIFGELRRAAQWRAIDMLRPARTGETWAA
jgi:glycosyltransferase involved in cell wall biosynthesis